MSIPYRVDEDGLAHRHLVAVVGVRCLVPLRHDEHWHEDDERPSNNV